MGEQTHTGSPDPLCKIPSGIPGLDFVTHGGLPEGRATLVAGSSGSGKTVFACHWLAAAIVERGEAAVFVSCEETPASIRSNMHTFGWSIAEWEQDQRWCFVDASPELDTGTVESGPFDLDALLARVRGAVERSGARCVVLDSIGTVFARFRNAGVIRLELQRIIAALDSAGLTSVVTVERDSEHGRITAFGVEEFVADSVIVLRNILANEKRRRTVEVLKMRGTSHYVGEVPFTISGGEGIRAIPLGAIELDQPATRNRRTSGNADMDALCGGGWYSDSITVVSGASGCGKTLVATEFVTRPAVEGERTLFFAFEESREQILRNAEIFGLDLREAIDSGRLRIVSLYPETCTLEQHLAEIKRILATFEPDRVAVDSLSAVERIAIGELPFRQFAVALTAALKQRHVMALFTTASDALVGSRKSAAIRISTLADSMILLRYVESDACVHRALSVLKMRGSAHDRRVRELLVDNAGLHIGEPFEGDTGILRVGGVAESPHGER